jgi:Fe-S cluster biogenesis protein NfuA
MTSSDQGDPLINAVVETVLRPLVAADGGTIRVTAQDHDSITIELGGACLGCPGKSFTVQQVLTPVLRRARQSLRVVRIVDAPVQ